MVSEATFPTNLGYISIEIFFPGPGAQTESEEKATLVNESVLFLTFENRKLFLNGNIPLISGKYGLRATFDHWKVFFLMRTYVWTWRRTETNLTLSSFVRVLT